MRYLSLLFFLVLSPFGHAHNIPALVPGSYVVEDRSEFLYTEAIEVTDRGGHEYGIDMCIRYSEFGCVKVKDLIVAYNEENDRFETVNLGRTTFLFDFQGTKASCTTQGVAVVLTQSDSGRLFARLRIAKTPTYRSNGGCIFRNFEWYVQEQALLKQ